MYRLLIALCALSLSTALIENSFLPVSRSPLRFLQSGSKSRSQLGAYSISYNGPTNADIVIPRQTYSPMNLQPETSTFKVKVGNTAENWVTGLAKALVNPIGKNAIQKEGVRQRAAVSTALDSFNKDLAMLDDTAARTPQLTRLELAVLFGTVGISTISPFILTEHIIEVLIPSMAALSASVGISAEYVGKTAVFNGKQVAANALQAAAESEVYLAQAERAKAISPLCVGIATTAAAFALLAPSLVKEISEVYSSEIITEIYLLCPLVAVLAAAIGGLAVQETLSLAGNAIGVGIRRFASGSGVGRTWLSQTEQVIASSTRTNEKWKSFALGVAPAPLFAAFIPGELATKSIVCAAVAAAQAAYYLSLAEYAIADAQESVATKQRQAAMAETYASQGCRAGSVLPFTSALAGLCIAAAAAAVELLPIVTSLELQAVLMGLFPGSAALAAAAASVSKAKCELDSTAAIGAAQALGESDPKREDPWKSTKGLIATSVKSTWRRISVRTAKIKNFIVGGFFLRAFFRALFKDDDDAEFEKEQAAAARRKQEMRTAMA